MCVHAKYGEEEGSKWILVKPNDNDVVVIVIQGVCFLVLNKIGLQLWVAYGQEKKLRRITIHNL